MLVRKLSHTGGESSCPKRSGLRAPLSCLSQARVGVAWGVIGAAIDCYETALAYAKSREQFGRPIAGFQLVQEKLVWMVQEITKAQLLALRLTRMMEAGKVLPRRFRWRNGTTFGWRSNARAKRATSWARPASPISTP